MTQPMNVWAELTIQPDVQTPHSVPQAVTDAMAGGGYQGKLELTEDLLRVISAVSELGKRTRWPPASASPPTAAR